MVREYATSDNVDQIICKIAVVSADGLTVRGTLLAIGIGPTGEFLSNTSHRNKTIADGNSLGSVAAQDGDYLARDRIQQQRERHVTGSVGQMGRRRQRCRRTRPSSNCRLGRVHGHRLRPAACRSVFGRTIAVLR